MFARHAPSASKSKPTSRARTAIVAAALAAGTLTGGVVMAGPAQAASTCYKWGEGGQTGNYQCRGSGFEFRVIVECRGWPHQYSGWIPARSYLQTAQAQCPWWSPVTRVIGEQR